MSGCSLLTYASLVTISLAPGTKLGYANFTNSSILYVNVNVLSGSFGNRCLLNLKIYAPNLELHY